VPVEEFSQLQYSALPSVEWQQRGENMDAPLRDCTIEEQCRVARFVWAEGVKPGEIHHHMLAQYGQSTISERRFMSGCKGLTIKV
jgi:phospholipase/lecithinase/hemolysin